MKTTSQKFRAEVANKALAKRVYKMRSEGISVKEVAEITGQKREHIRALQLLGERLLTVEDV